MYQKWNSARRRAQGGIPGGHPGGGRQNQGNRGEPGTPGRRAGAGRGRPAGVSRLRGGPRAHRLGRLRHRLRRDGLQRAERYHKPPDAGNRRREAPGSGIAQGRRGGGDLRLRRPGQRQRAGRHLYHNQDRGQTGGRYGSPGRCGHEMRLRREP